ncbi:MAG: 16S rRNA (cytosine(1402)-N(4))-methyltransferase RsmH [Saprospiraceae bacterium]|nr:16S rRNA (cytosine(1402)-N(4))-methyltransferase RsmH [Saprospiraceae bacterium]
MYHSPVLLKESIEGLAVKPNGTYVDVTFGGGGHSRKILEKLKDGKLIGFDQDEDAQPNMLDDERFQLINQNFKYLKNFLKLYNAFPVDGILADLGVSSFQFDEAKRGFSIRFDGELDLRMDKSSKLSAKEIVSEYPYEELKRVFRNYGEIENASKLANKIIEKRTVNPIETTSQLKEAIVQCVQRGKENKYYARVFQALRIEVNDELEVLRELLLQSVDVLNKGGRIVVISYHSLEDRLVKNFFKSGNFEGRIEKDFYGNPIVPFKLINRKVIVPGEEEIEKNNRSRSAKLRVAEKI